MKAVWYEQPGAAADVLQYGEQETPEPQPGEVRVRVHVSGVNPSDTKFRSGWMGLRQPYPLTVPHNDGAGVIDAVGTGVAQTRLGERVWVYEAQRGSAFGTAAEWVTVPAHKAVKMPDTLDYAAGASLGVPAMTAHFLVFSDGPVTGQTVLVHGGAGAVGIYTLQLAKWGGAKTVIATVSSEEKARVARQMGADYTVNYRSQDVVAMVRSQVGKRGCDRITDVALNTNIHANAKLLSRNGVIATYESGDAPTVALPFYDLLYKNATLRTVLVYAMSDAAHQAAIQDLTTMVTAGQLQHCIAQRFALTNAVAAHEAVEQGQRIGKVVLDLSL